jgi:hypothetical protein
MPRSGIDVAAILYTELLSINLALNYCEVHSIQENHSSAGKLLRETSSASWNVNVGKERIITLKCYLSAGAKDTSHLPHIFKPARFRLHCYPSDTRNIGESLGKGLR